MPGCAGKPCTDSFCKGHSRANCTAHINQLLSCEAIKDIDFGQIKVLAEALEHRENNSQRALDEDTYNAKVTAITRSEA
jgi:spore coat protein U-like protein